MQTCATETISGFNGFVETLKKGETGKNRFTLTQFDSQGIDVLHDAVPLAKVMKLDSETFKPRGNTPLHDAIGRTIKATEKQAGAKYKVLFVTLTDGMENASSEWNDVSIKNLIKEKEDKDKWTFAHIGVGVGGWAATNKLAQGTQSVSNFVHVTPQNVKKAFGATASAARSYMRCAVSGQSVSAAFYAGHKEEDESSAS